MKISKPLAAAAAMLSCAALSLNASAVIIAPEEKSALLDTAGGKWSVSISSSYTIDYTAVYDIEAVLKLTDEEAYLSDKASGFYGDTETEFGDFSGQVAFGGSEWLSYTFTGLEETAAEGTNAAVTPLGDNTYSIRGVFGDAGINNTLARCSVSVSEWGNTAENYGLEVLSLSLHDSAGNTILAYGADGNVTVEPSADGTAVDTAPEETEAAPEETEAVTEAETTTAAAETRPEETTKRETNTSGAVTAAEQTAPTDFAERDSGLMIILIAAVAVIVAVIIGFIIIAVKRKKR